MLNDDDELARKRVEVVVNKYAVTCSFDDTALKDGEEDVNKHFLFDERVGGGGRGLVARAIYDPSAIRHSPESHEHTLSPHVLSFKIDLLWSYASKVCVVCKLPLSYQANTNIWQMLQCFALERWDSI